MQTDCEFDYSIILSGGKFFDTFLKKPGGKIPAGMALICQYEGVLELHPEIPQPLVGGLGACEISIGI